MALAVPVALRTGTPGSTGGFVSHGFTSDQAWQWFNLIRPNPADLAWGEASPVGCLGMDSRVATVNGRAIFERPPIGTYLTAWWLVEVTGRPGWSYRKCDMLEAAIAEAERLGPLPDQPDQIP